MVEYPNVFLFDVEKGFVLLNSERIALWMLLRDEELRR